MKEKPRVLIDGKPVRCWLFVRRGVSLVNGRDFPELHQVEAFNLDHAWQRMRDEICPGFAHSSMEMLEELDPEHFVGKMGRYWSLNPLVVVPGSFMKH